ncbi:MAG: tryptophan 7-halogenase [Cyanobacteria bacterium P01_F01_bin.53]
MTYSAAIIGAGPAGCAAAIALTQTGHNVLLIEASAFPRHRPGESLHPGVEPIFKTLGIDEAINAAGFLRYPGHRVAWRASEPNNNKPERLEKFGQDAGGDWLGYQAWRPTLDQILLDAAITRGVTVWQPCRVKAAIIENNQLTGLSTGRGLVQADYFLDASGQSQWLSRQLGITTTAYSPTMRARFGYVACEAGEHPFDIPLIRSESDGWSWIARVREDRCAWSRMRLGQGKSDENWRPEELADCVPVGKTKGVDVTWRLSDRTAGDNWFLLGDAAAVLDPAASHGVLKSLMSGMQAAHAIAACTSGKVTAEKAAQGYSQWLGDWFKSDVERMEELYHIGQINHPANKRAHPRSNHVSATHQAA